MTSRPGKPLIAMHILLNISRSKHNKAKIFGQLIEWETFENLNNYTQNVVEKLFPDPFLKSQRFILFVFIACQVECYWYILELSCSPLAFIS